MIIEIQQTFLLLIAAVMVIARIDNELKLNFPDSVKIIGVIIWTTSMVAAFIATAIRIWT